MLHSLLKCCIASEAKVFTRVLTYVNLEDKKEEIFFE